MEYGNQGGYGNQGDSYEKPVKVDGEYDVTIDEVGVKGDGIARVQGFVVFVPNTKKGENVKIRVTQVMRKFAIGEKVGEAAAPAADAAPEAAAEEASVDEAAPEEADAEAADAAEEAPAEEAPAADAAEEAPADDAKAEEAPAEEAPAEEKAEDVEFEEK